MVKWYSYLLFIFFLNFKRCLIFFVRGIFLWSEGLVGLFLLLGNNVGKVNVVKKGVRYLFNGLLFIVG